MFQPNYFPRVDLGILKLLQLLVESSFSIQRLKNSDNYSKIIQLWQNSDSFCLFSVHSPSPYSDYCVLTVFLSNTSTQFIKYLPYAYWYYIASFLDKANHYLYNVSLGVKCGCEAIEGGTGDISIFIFL